MNVVRDYRRLLLALLSIGMAASIAIHARFVPSTALAALSSGIVISQVYGGGGNSGATLKNDFIELFNAGGSTVDVSGWSVQYASASGTSWQITNLCAGGSTCTIAPGHYYLIQEAKGSAGTTDLPTPDATGAITMSAT